MEREGEVGREMKRRGRRGGGEKRKGIIVGGVVLSLLLGCNNGLSEELSVEKRLGEVGRSAEKAFYSFVDFIADTLGFRVTKETTKQKVGEYFSKLGGKIGEASAELEKVAEKATSDGDKDVPLSKAIREAVEAAKGVLDKLKSHLESLKGIGDADKVGELATNKNGAAANEEALRIAYDALRGIVDTAKTQNVEEPKKSDLAVDTTKVGGTTPQNGAKALVSGNVAGAAAGLEAAAIVSAVNGKEILAAIVDSKKEDATGTIGKAADGTTSALKFARGDSDHSNLSQTTVLAGAVSGGIALRSLVKEGKLAANSGGNDKKGAEVAGRSATNKLLRAVEDIIKRTVKKVLDKAKVEIDKVKASKTTVQ